MLQNTLKATIKAHPFGCACAAFIVLAALAFVVSMGYTSFSRSAHHDVADLFMAGIAAVGAAVVAMLSLQGFVRAAEWLDGLFR